MSSFIVINEIEELLNDMNDGLTSTLSTISSNVNTIKTNVASILTNTSATTTENNSGTLSAKLTYLINRRDKIITPSSTNIKTLSSSGSSDITPPHTTSPMSIVGNNGQVFSCYIKYPGVYRVYGTASGTVNTTGGLLSYTTGIAKIVLCAYTNSINSGNVFTVDMSSVNVTKSQSYSLASATKTIDIGATSGDILSVCIRGESTAHFAHPCGGSEYWGSNMTVSWTNLSVRGTASEYNSAIV